MLFQNQTNGYALLAYYSQFIFDSQQVLTAKKKMPIQHFHFRKRPSGNLQENVVNFIADGITSISQVIPIALSGLIFE